MKAHRIETALTESGKLSLENLPFQKGDQVEIIILDLSSSQTDSDSMPLKGTVISYDEAFEPATALEDWGVINPIPHLNQG